MAQNLFTPLTDGVIPADILKAEFARRLQQHEALLLAARAILSSVRERHPDFNDLKGGVFLVSHELLTALDKATEY